MNGCYRSRVIRAEIVIEKVTSLILLVECIPRKRGCTLQRLAFCKLPSVHEKHPHARTHWLRFSHFLSVCLSFCLHEKPQKNQDENTIFILQLTSFYSSAYSCSSDCSRSRSSASMYSCSSDYQDQVPIHVQGHRGVQTIFVESHWWSPVKRFHILMHSLHSPRLKYTV